jgi:ribonuclease III
VPPDGGDLYEVALTHRSFAFEDVDHHRQHNERLEFLGDAILGAVVTDLIYDTHPELAEGDMARLRASVVNTQALADLARDVGIGEHLKLGKGEEGSGGRDKASILADTLEAVVGAVYVARGIDAVRSALVPLFTDLIDRSFAGLPFDPKTLLQEVVARREGVFPTYRVSSSGPDHDKRFDATVLIEGRDFGSGSGRSKKEAEQHAAREALQRLEIDKRPTDPSTTRSPDARAS